MTDFNKLTVHGRIVKNADFTTTDSGLYVAKFSIAVNRSRRLPDGTYSSEDETSFFPLAIFGKYATSLGPYLVKGRGILVEGHLKQQRWEHEGEKRSENIIAVERIYFDPAQRKSEDVKPVAGDECPFGDSQIVEKNAMSETELYMASQAFDFPPAEVAENFEIF